MPVLTFNLPEEEHTSLPYLYGPRYLSVLREFSNWLRSEVKYGDHYIMETDAVREKLWEFMEAHSVTYEDGEPPCL